MFTVLESRFKSRQIIAPKAGRTFKPEIWAVFVINVFLAKRYPALAKLFSQLTDKILPVTLPKHLYSLVNVPDVLDDGFMFLQDLDDGVHICAVAAAIEELIDDIPVLLQSLVDVDEWICGPKAFFEPPQDVVAVGDAAVSVLILTSALCLAAVRRKEEEFELLAAIAAVLDTVFSVITNLIYPLA